MIKGFIDFRNGRIPFVVEDYRLELFTDDIILEDFVNEYNYKNHYILHGQCFSNGICGQKATFLVEHSMGSTCYLYCYTINVLNEENKYDTIGFQSPFLDDVFRYKYNYLDMVRAGVNLAVEPKDAYNVHFSMNDKQYELLFRIGHNNRLGLWEDFDRKGELLIPLQTNDIQECYDISVVLYRLAMFMMSHSEVPFKRITLYKKNGLKAGWFYSPLVLEEVGSGYDVLFCNFDVMKYVPKILNNIALDSGNEITQSIPLGHLGNFDSMFSPQRFIEQVMSFEYLFDKLDHKRAKDTGFALKKELKTMFDKFPQLLSNTKLSADEVSEEIKNLRHTIAHGHAYYYDFKNDSNRYLMLLLDRLIRNMSLLCIGFSKDEITEYPIY